MNKNHSHDTGMQLESPVQKSVGGCCNSSRAQDSAETPHTHDAGLVRQELPVVASVSVLLIVGTLFEEQLHSGWGIGVEYALMLTAWAVAGAEVLKTAGRNLLRGQIFDENFLMTVATVGAIAIHKLPEAVSVMLFYRIGELVQSVALGSARRSIRALLAIRPDQALLETDAGLQAVRSEAVEPRQIIVVRPGNRIPLDGEVISGQSAVDTAALTGESLPRSVALGDTVLAGTIALDGQLRIRVSRTFNNSSLARILDLVENAAASKAPTERFISRFARIYTPIVVLLSLAVALLPPLVGLGDLQTWAYRALVLLVISCPCGLVISIPLGYFGGIGGAARRGILVKGSNFIDALAKVRLVAFDKTGTLTQGMFRIQALEVQPPFTEKDLRRWAATVERQSSHPIARSISRELATILAEPLPPVGMVREHTGQGIEAQVGQQRLWVGNDRLLHRAGIEHPACETNASVVYVAVDNQYVGAIRLADAPHPEAAQTVAALHRLGVRKVGVFSGDAPAVVAELATQLGLDSWQGGLLPEDKVEAVKLWEQQRRPGETLAYVGDGINDAPVLASADVGLAMGALGSDAAIETADVVLMAATPLKVPEAIALARRTLGIVKQNICLAVAIKGLFIVLGILGLATLWEAVFADVGVALLAVLNATRILR